MKALGIDIGGSGIKGARVDVDTGLLLTERYRIPTPWPATPQAVADCVREVVQYFKWTGPVGCAFPAVVKKGIVYSAANIDPAWIGTRGERLFERKTGCSVALVNDADAAGMAEMTFGVGQGRRGVVMMLTFGTGIGSAVFIDGQLVPNTELGHLEIRGRDAEQRASDRVREEREMSWKKWAARVDEVLHALERLFSPDLFVIGGGVSRQHRSFLPKLTTRTRVVPARLRNDAGIVGAAMAARSIS